MTMLEALSYVVTILGFPTAVFVFVYEQRKRQRAETDELHRGLSEEYDNFLKLGLDHADLLLFRRERSAAEFSEEQLERRDLMFRMLISLFEKAFIILHDEDMDEEARRRWNSWEDDMAEWCRRDDFRALLPVLLEGEDDAFARYLRAMAAEAEAAAMS